MRLLHINKETIFNFIKKYKHYIVLFLVFILIISITFYISFAYFRDTSTTDLITGKLGNIKETDITIKYMIENRNASGAGNGTYYENHSAPYRDYTFTTTGSGCTNGATYTVDDDNYFNISAEEATICTFYFNAENVNTSEDFILNIKKELKRIDGSGSGLYENVTNTTIPGLIFLGYKYNSSTSSCTSGTTLTYNNFTKKLTTSNNASNKTCTAYFDAVVNPEVYFYGDNGGVFSHGFVSVPKGGSETVTFYPPSGVTSDELILTCEDGITASLDGNTINLTKVDNSGVCSVGSPKKYSEIGTSYYTPLIDGFYKIQLWGAEGGYSGGKGGYAEGIIYLTKNSNLVVTVGGQGYVGSTACSGDGFNGGGCAFATSGGGGGATDVRVTGGALEHRIIVAGGGGGKGQDTCAAGAPASIGGLNQGSCGLQGGGGSTISGGDRGSIGTVYGNVGTFGLGANAITGTKKGGAGGGGWFGGGSGASAASYSSGGGGGSSFVLTEIHPESLLTNRYFLTNPIAAGGDATFLSPTGTSETGHSGDGYVKITFAGF